MCCLLKNLFVCILILLNVLLLLVSAAFIFFGVMIGFFFSTLTGWFSNWMNDITPELEKAIIAFGTYVQTYSFGIGIVLLIVGVFVFVISLFGFLGLCCKHVGFTITYSTLIGLLAACIVTFGVIVLVDFSIILGPLTSSMSFLIRTEFDDPDNPVYQGAIATIQPVTAGLVYFLRILPCCGVEAFTEFSESPTWKREYKYETETVSPAAVPVMCCKNRHSVKSPKTGLNYYRPGETLDTSCLREPTADNSYIGLTCALYLEQQAAPIGYVILAIGGFVILIFGAAVALTCSYKKKNRVGRMV